MLLPPLKFTFNFVRNVLFTNALSDSIDWGSKLVWHTTLKEAEEVSHRSKKPIMVIIYHTDCPSCHWLLPKITHDERIAEEARFFTVVALQEPDAKDDLRIDGNYTPRIYFLSYNGEVQEQFFNRHGNPKYKFYYPNEKALLKTMKEVKKELGH